MLSHPVHQGLAVAATAIIVVIAVACYSIYSDHQEAVESDRLLLHDLADVVAEHTTQSILRTDTALREIRDAVLLSGGLKDFAAQTHWGELQRMAGHIPGVVGVVLADPEGRVVATSTHFPTPPMSLATRNYMRTLAQDDVLDIGPAVTSRLKPGEVIYTISRRLVGHRGEFIGVVSAGISTHYLTEFYGLVGASKNALIEVCGVNGDILARKPVVLEYVGRNLAESPLFSRDIPAASEGATEFRSPLDKLDRLAAWKVLAPYPLVIVVGFEMNEVEHNWRRRTERNVLRSLVGLLIIAGVTCWSIALLRRDQSTRRRLAAALQARAADSKALNDARIDHVTGLPARTLFMESAESLLATCANTSQRMAILYVDLDGFKNVNDSQGHAAGDRVLAQSAHILRATLREGDIAGRMGGDEFAACVTASADRIEALASLIGSRIVAAIGAADTGIGCSVGIAFCNGSEPLAFGAALKLADGAMYEAKRRGKGRLVISARSHLPAGKSNISDVLTGRSG